MTNEPAAMRYRLYDLQGYGDMIEDRVRVKEFSAALSEVAPDKVLLEVGGGTGFFACLAAKKGARRVISVDLNAAIKLGPATAKRNGLEKEQVRFVHGNSLTLELEEKADVLLHDMRGQLPLIDHSFSTLLDARRRLLKPDAVFLPKRDLLWGCLVSDPIFYSEMEGVWGGRLEGIDLTDARLKTHGRKRYKPSPESRPWARHLLQTVDYATLDSETLSGSFSMRAAKGGECHGLCLWSDMHLTESIRFSSDPWLPEDERARVYGVSFAPWPTPVTLVEGQHYSVEISIDSAGALTVALYQELSWSRKQISAFSDGETAQSLPLKHQILKSESTAWYRMALELIQQENTIEEALAKLVASFPSLAERGQAVELLQSCLFLTEAELKPQQTMSKTLTFGDSSLRIEVDDEELLTMALELLAPSWHEVEGPDNKGAVLSLERAITPAGARYRVAGQLLQPNSLGIAQERIRELALKAVARESQEHLVLECGYFLGPKGATLVFEDDQGLRKQKVDELLGESLVSDFRAALLNARGELVPYLQAGVPETHFPIHQVIFPGSELPRLALCITLMTGRSHNPKVFGNPFAFFQQILAKATLQTYPQPAPGH